MLPPISHLIQVDEFKPNKADPSATRSAQLEALAALQGTEGYKEVIFEGKAVESPDVSVRAVEWAKSPDLAFTSNTPYKSFQAKLNASRLDTLTSAHYNIYGSIHETLKDKPLCMEWVVYTLKDGVTFEEFYKGWKAGLKPVEECEGSGSIALGQQVENPQGVIQIQPWGTYDLHMTVFKGRPDINEMMAPLSVMVDKWLVGGWGGMHFYHLTLTPPGEAV